jgi:hypothetical protein
MMAFKSCRLSEQTGLSGGEKGLGMISMKMFHYSKNVVEEGARDDIYEEVSFLKKRRRRCEQIQIKVLTGKKARKL